MAKNMIHLIISLHKYNDFESYFKPTLNSISNSISPMSRPCSDFKIIYSLAYIARRIVLLLKLAACSSHRIVACKFFLRKLISANSMGMKQATSVQNI